MSSPSKIQSNVKNILVASPLRTKFSYTSTRPRTERTIESSLWSCMEPAWFSRDSVRKPLPAVIAVGWETVSWFSSSFSILSMVPTTILIVTVDTSLASSLSKSMGASGAWSDVTPATGVLTKIAGAWSETVWTSSATLVVFADSSTVL